MNFFNLNIAALSVLLIMTSSPRLHAALGCESVLTTLADRVAQVKLDGAKYTRNDVIQSLTLLATRDERAETGAEAKKIDADLLTVLSDYETPYRQDFGLKLNARLQGTETPEQLKQILFELITPIQPAGEARQMIERYFAGEVSLKELQGSFTHEQFLNRLMGQSTATEIDPNSMMGEFLAEAAVIKGAPIAKANMGFPVADQPGVYGSPKWFVSLDASLFPLYTKYFGGSHFLTHLHSQGQGTLLIGHNGKTGSYANLASDARMQGVNSLWPSIVFSSVEANRMRLFSEMGKIQNQNNVGQYPWGLVNVEGTTVTQYVSKGFFTCCTHWFGNLPVGEGLTNQYLLPGNNPANAAGATPILSEIRPYNQIAQFAMGQTLPANFQLPPYSGSQMIAAHPYTQLTWTAPGHKQLWEVLGLRDSQITGELANPGYVASALVAKTDSTYVPFVFVTTLNATQTLPPVETMNTWISRH